MSYDLKRSHFSVILERKVASGSVVTEEGVVLVASLDAGTGEEVVDLSDGTAQAVAGFAIRDNADNATTSAVEVQAVPASGTLEATLSNNNLVAANIRIVDSAGTALTEGNPASPDEYSVVDATGVITFNANQAGLDVTVTYRYNLTVAEARLKFFQRNINNEAGALFGQVGVGHGHGEIFTDQFDAAVDWATASDPSAGAAGQVVEAGSGSNLGRVISVPNVNNPLLGLNFDIGGAVV